MLYPILTDSRCLMDLSGTWDFKADRENRGFEEKWYAGPLTEAETMPVPASYNDLKEDFNLKEHYGWVFYQRTVMVPRIFTNQRIVLRMAAVTHKARVYWNGELVSTHKGGFLPFEADLTGHISEGENRLTIAVDNRIDRTTLPVGDEKSMFDSDGVSTVQKRNYPQFDFFNYCGITRPVKIYTTPMHYIEDITLVPETEGRDARIHFSVATGISGEMGNGDTNSEPSGVKVEVYDQTGGQVCRAEGQLRHPAGSLASENRDSVCRGVFEGMLEIKNVHLWQPGNAYLYQVRVTYGEDVYVLPYGVRTVKVSGNRFLINGQPFYFKGYGKHEDTFPNGRGFNPVMNAKDISLMKWMGANSFRTSHYPYSEEMMRLCDAEGIVVIDETPAVGVNLRFGGGAAAKNREMTTFRPYDEGGVGTFEHHQEVIRDLIARDKNHACVVMWSIANEPDSSAAGAYEYFKPLFDLAKASDPQKRPCTLVSMMEPNWDEDVTVKLSDVICLNRYIGWYVLGGELEASEVALRKELEGWNAIGKPFMFTEYGADTVAGLRDTVPVMFTEEYQVEYYKMNERVIDTLDNFIGEQVWNFADFATSQGIMRVQGNKKGIFTRDRRPKMAAYHLKERWTKIPDFGYKS
ncbi:MAG: beta-glucuronidase [Catenibacillus sp.]